MTTQLLTKASTEALEELVKAKLDESTNDKVTKVFAKELVKTVFESLTELLLANDQVTVNKFGIFKLVKKEESVGRNPKTGEPTTISARTSVRLQALKGLKDTLIETYNK
jgi:nucleoid DNA-binding protein